MKTADHEVLSKAKTRLVLRHPFYASILLGMPTHIVPDLNPPTMATDGQSILIHPSCFEKWTVDEVMGVLAHEVLHTAMLHPWRKGHREHRKWNCATDYAINHILEQSGLTLPKEGLRDSNLGPKSAEEIYTLLPDPPKDDKGKGESGDGQGDGQGDDMFDNVMDAPGTEAERQQSEAETKVRIKQAANLAKAQGKLPGALADLVDKVLEPVIDWKAELRRYMTAILKTDQSWQRGQRRFLSQGLYLPAFHTPGMGRVVVGIDTSGSIVDAAPEFLSEVRAICEECKPSSITVIQCDAKVQAIDEYEVGDEIKCEIKGGGGTDLRPAIKTAGEYDTLPVIMIWLSDGETPYSPEPPEFPVIWCLTTKVDPPWGDVIRMS